MNPNYLLDREFFNIQTRNNNTNANEKKESKITNNIVYMDRKQFEKQKPLFLEEKNTDEPLYKTSINMIQEDEKNKKIQNMQFNPYLTQFRNAKSSMDRFSYENDNQKEQIYYTPYERNNIRIENKNLNKLDFIDKNKKSEYYKNIDLKKFNPNINYKEFLSKK